MDGRKKAEIRIEDMLRMSQAARNGGNYLESLYFTQKAYSLCPDDIRDPRAE